MPWDLKEAFAYYIKKKYSGDMPTSIEGLSDVIAIGLRHGVITPIVRPGSTLSVQDVMHKAGIRPERGSQRGRVTILSRDIEVAAVSRFSKKTPKL